MLTFLHTSAAHVEPFFQLARDVDAAIPTRHAVREDLLAAAVAGGGVGGALRVQIAQAVQALASDGARLVVCTCSTIAALAEASATASCPVLRIDRPMAERAVASGRRIVVLAALSSTLEPTRALLHQVALEADRSPVIAEALCEGAWELFAAGDRPSYAANIARKIEAVAAPGDLVLLAQASMAPAVELVGHLNIPVLCSPRSGVEAAVARYRAAIPAPAP